VSIRGRAAPGLAWRRAVTSSTAAEDVLQAAMCLAGVWSVHETWRDAEQECA
jgi:hypothetical protein